MKFLNSNLEDNPEIISGDGPWLRTVDGRKLFDCWLGSGTLIFGHEKTDYAPVGTKMLPSGVKLEEGFQIALKALVNFQIASIGFQTGGSAAVSRACRLARAATGRTKIAVVGNFWHGSDDNFLFKNHHEPLSTGVVSDNGLLVQYFEDTASFIANAQLTDFAALMVEPFQGSNPSHSMLDDITPAVRDNMKAAGTLLICDEVITGFRECYGSCLESRRVEPDIVVFGKAIANGFPVGVVLVSDSVPITAKQLPFWGGTFAASPWQISVISSHLNRLNDLKYEALISNHIEMKNYLKSNIHFENFGYELNYGPFFARISILNRGKTAREFLSDQGNARRKMHDELLDKGIHIGHNGLIFPSIYNIAEATVE